MRKLALTLVCPALLCTVNGALADQLRAPCGKLLSVSAGEASYLYYKAETALGADAASRLWAAYHQLKTRCASRPDASVVVNVEPKVKAFIEANR
jgi:hypothetical protein